jgi:hypothetical protein
MRERSLKFILRQETFRLRVYTVHDVYKCWLIHQVCSFMLSPLAVYALSFEFRSPSFQILSPADSSFNILTLPMYLANIILSSVRNTETEIPSGMFLSSTISLRITAKDLN